MSKEEIVNYVMNTPGNTNPAVLRSMLDSEEESNKELPPIEAGDARKVLTVNEEETAAEWAAPSGGGASYYESAGVTNVVNTEITWTDHGHMEFQGSVIIKAIPLADAQNGSIFVITEDLPIYVDSNLIGTFKAGSYPDDSGNVEYPDGWNNEYGMFLTADNDETNYYMLIGIDDSTEHFSHSSNVMTAVSVGLIKPTDLFATLVRAVANS